MPFTYILFSEAIQKFYIGSTSLAPEERLLRHLSNHKGFTNRVKDWKINKNSLSGRIPKQAGSDKQGNANKEMEKYVTDKRIN